jgi:hypothetical protein
MIFPSTISRHVAPIARTPTPLFHSISASGNTAPSLMRRHSEQEASGFQSILLRRVLQRILSRRSSRTKRRAVTVNLFQVFRSTCSFAVFNLTQIVFLCQKRMPPPKSKPAHQKPSIQKTRRYPALRVRQCLRHRISAYEMLFFVAEIPPEQQRIHHALQRISLIRHQLVRQHREGPLALAASKPRNKDHPLPIRTKLYDRSRIRPNTTEPAGAPANRAHPPRLRPPVDFFTLICFLVLPNGAEAVNVCLLDALYPAPGKSGISHRLPFFVWTFGQFIAVLFLHRTSDQKHIPGPSNL